MRLNAREVDDMGGKMAHQIEPIEYERIDHARQTGANESGPTPFFDQHIFIKIQLGFPSKLESRSHGANGCRMQLLLWLQPEAYFCK